MTQSTITDKFQTTIPLAVRLTLKLKPRQRVNYEVRADGSVVLRPAPGLDQLFGSIRPKRPVASTCDEKQAAREAIARDAASGSTPQPLAPFSSNGLRRFLRKSPSFPLTRF
ncbi:MAG: hypothetical protein EBT61_20695 [Verrucomicrobia bacterium]|nr:hypothetical protein [Verrucomicrobiota bacterium]